MLPFSNRMIRNINTKSLVLIPLAIGINLMCGTLCQVLKLPLFLDSIGTILIACLCGPLIASLCGLSTNIFLGIVSNPVNIPYGLVSVLIGITSGILNKYGFFSSKYKAVISWIIISIINTIGASLVTMFVFGGSSGLNTGSIFTAVLIATTKDIFLSVLSYSMLENLIDKFIVVFIVYSLLRKIPNNFKNQFATL